MAKRFLEKYGNHDFDVNVKTQIFCRVFNVCCRAVVSVEKAGTFGFTAFCFDRHFD